MATSNANEKLATTVWFIGVTPGRDEREWRKAEARRFGSLCRGHQVILTQSCSLFSQRSVVCVLRCVGFTVFGKSKIEYVIHETLRQARETNERTFRYAEELELTVSSNASP